MLQPPTNSLYSLDKVNDTPQLPIRVPSSPEAITNPTEDLVHFSESSDIESSESSNVWYAIYEGHCKEVTICNLTPGRTFQFRVRASSHRPTASSQLQTRAFNPSTLTAWGHASFTPLSVDTPAVPPINPPSNLRVLGPSKPTELRLTWDPPTLNGGAPILCYELWQSLFDPISGSHINAIPNTYQSPAVGITASESMKDLHGEVKSPPKATALSAPSSIPTSPQHKDTVTSTTNTNNSKLIFTGLENSCEVRGLHSGQSFDVRVRARNSTGWSNWSEWTTFKTAPSPPGVLNTPPRIKPTSATSVVVSWEKIVETNGAPITEYRVEWQPSVAEPPQTCTPPEGEHEEELLLLPSATDSNDLSRSRNPSSCSSSVAASKTLNDGFILVITCFLILSFGFIYLVRLVYNSNFLLQFLLLLQTFLSMGVTSHSSGQICQGSQNPSIQSGQLDIVSYF